MRIRISGTAHRDILRGRQFYDSLEQGIGHYFSDTIYGDIRSLMNFAGIHPIRYGYYMMLVRRFPYVIYYEKEDALVTVVAVLDCRRDPEWISNRLAVFPS